MSQPAQSWERFCKYYFADSHLGFALDASRVRFDAAGLAALAPKMATALASMERLEAGGIANPDENRQVGHYWLRDPEIAPTAEIRAAIESAQVEIREFANAVHAGDIQGAGGPFQRAALIGIGGSALGPQLLNDALGGAADRLQFHFFDNVDPDGFERILRELDGQLGQTLVIVISKSGGTPETRIAMQEVRYAYRQAGWDFTSHAVAVTKEESELDLLARGERWLRTFPLWDWVGGRTSIMSAVGLLPAALQGLDTTAFLDGAREMDRHTREADVLRNPAAMLAVLWHHIGNGKGEKDMVVLPYKDRLLLFSRYLQQLVMESLGKELSRDGKVVHQGIAVYGNKGSTDQHAYVQQLREGVHNFFVTFIQVLKDRDAPAPEIEPGRTSGDYLRGFYLGTREALSEKGRDSISITIDAVTEHTLGALIALYERAVGLYAELVNINAYHQPGVEAGKAAAGDVLALQDRVLAHLDGAGSAQTAAEIAAELGEPDTDKAEMVFKILEHLAANGERGIIMEAAGSPARATFCRRS